MLTTSVNNSKIVSAASSPRMIGLVRHEADDEDRRDRQADARQRGSQRQIDRALKPVSQCGPDSGQGFGRQYQHRHEQTPERGRRTQNADAVINRHRDLFGQENNRDDIRQQQQAVVGHRLNLKPAMHRPHLADPS